METLREWFQGTERPTHIVFGPSSYMPSNDPFKGKLPPYGELVEFDENAAWLDIQFEAGFGDGECPALNAWSPNWVYFVGLYDGAQDLVNIPRHPVGDIAAAMPGGG